MVERDTLISVTGGVGASVVTVLKNAEWMSQVVIGAMIGAVVSFFISKALTCLYNKIFNKN